MNLEDRVKQHFDERITGAEPAAIESVISRGTRLRRRALAGRAFLYFGAMAAVVAATIALSGQAPLQPEVVSPSPDMSLYDQVAEGWTPVPGPVDPDLAAIAAELCPFDLSQLDDRADIGTPVGEPAILAIDQRGISARILHGVESSNGSMAVNCAAIEVDGAWISGADLGDDLPQMVTSSGGPVPDYVAEMRLRFPDGTEVMATIGGGEYVMHYPSTLHDALARPNDYAYMESYSKEGALISSDLYLSSRDVEAIESTTETSDRTTYPTQVGLPFPDLDLQPVGEDRVAATIAGEPLVVTIWAPWCAPCRQQLLAVQQFADETGITAVGISVKASAAESAEMLNELGISFANSLTSQNNAMSQLGLLGLPATFTVDEDGIVTTFTAGFISVESLLESVVDSE